MALLDNDVRDIKDFTEQQIRFCLNDKKAPDEKDIKYLLLLAETGSQAVSQSLAINHLDSQVAYYLINPSKIFPYRSHITPDDDQIMKLYMRLAILRYLQDFPTSEALKNAISKIEDILNKELSELEIKNKRQVLEVEIENKHQLLKQFKTIYNSLQGNLLTKEKLFQAAEGVFVFSLLATGYLFYNFGKVFLNVGSVDATSIAKLLYENVWPAFPYPMFSFIASGALVVFSDHLGKKVQENINAAYFVGMTTGQYPNMGALIQEAQEKIANLEKELKNSEVLQQECKDMPSQSFTYQKTTALLTQNATQSNIPKKTSTNRSEENAGLTAGELNVAAGHETENFVADCTTDVFSFR